MGGTCVWPQIDGCWKALDVLETAFLESVLCGDTRLGQCLSFIFLPDGELWGKVWESCDSCTFFYGPGAVMEAAYNDY